VLNNGNRSPLGIHQAFIVNLKNIFAAQHLRTDVYQAQTTAVMSSTTNTRPLEGKVAIVTGSAKPNGIGFAVAKALAEKGSNVSAFNSHVRLGTFAHKQIRW
jgi:3-oxoacyl-ACP reductase-like protein